MIRRPYAMFVETAKSRPLNYLDVAMSLGQLDGEDLVFTPTNFHKMTKIFSPENEKLVRDMLGLPKPISEWPFWAKGMAKFSTPDDKGLGDTVSRIIGPVGGDAFKEWYKHVFGQECGCADRQAYLNEVYPLTDKEN